MYRIVSERSRPRIQLHAAKSVRLLVIHAEMAKIAMLKAKIMRIDVAFKELPLPAVSQSAMDDLQLWHSQLPVAARLSSLDRTHGTHNDVLRRAVYHVHLLYLGAVVMLHRRIASQYSEAADRTAAMSPRLQPAIAYNHSQNGILAAKQSASIMKLLQSENGISERGWLVMYVCEHDTNSTRLEYSHTYFAGSSRTPPP
jgi:hypothetical protein